MGTEFIALAAAAAFLAYAILTAREIGLIAAITCYAAVVGWIIQRDLSLLMVALGGAIALAVMGLAVMLYREALSQEDMVRYSSRKLGANNRAIPENIGS